MPEKCIVLESKPAHRYTSRTGSLAQDNVLKGSLLVELTEDEARESQQFFTTPLNYKKYSNNLVKLYCEPEYVCQLNDKQFNLLLAVKSTFDCYKAFDILHWVEKLRVGDEVNVTTFSNLQPARGVIRYIGSVHGEEGTMFGVELLERRGEGTSNGKYRHLEYFKCEHKCGVFVCMDKLSGPKHKARIPSPATDDALLKLGDGVVFHSESDKPVVRGTVRWIGVNKVALPSGGKIVGIETVQKIAVPGSLRGMNHFFTLRNSKGTQLFLPISSVIKDANNSTPATGISHNIQRSKSENDDDVSPPVLESLRLVPTCKYQTQTSSYVQALCSPPGPSSSIPVGGRSALSYSNPSIRCNYASGHKDDRCRSHSLDSVPWSPSQIDSNPHNLVVGSAVLYGTPPLSGVIKWMGYPIGVNSYSAGIEMDEPIAGGNDGTWQGTKYFDSHPGRGTFVRVTSLRPARGIRPEEVEGELSSSYESTEASAQFRHDPITQDRQSLIDRNTYGSQLNTSSTTANELHHRLKEIEEQQKVNVLENANRIEAVKRQLVEVQRNNEQLQVGNGQLQNQLSLTQQQLSDVQKSNELLQTSNEYLKDQLSLIQQNLLDIQRNNDRLQAALQNQSSLTQQQLLGVQSMMTCTRWWVVTHDQFTIGREIGRGAWASVHEASFRGATVAAKCLHELITAPRTRQLFQREMEMALQCQHRNIVTFLGSTLEGPPVILMELMDTSLRSAYEQGRIRDHQVLGILYDIASALHFLHTRPDPVIHRDVSSANVLLKAQYNREWLAKVGDMGTAKIQQQAATAGPGAIAYGAPEAGDFTKHSPKMDVYSYGVLVLEILTKTHPFQIVDDLKVQVQQQFPQYHQLVTSCTNQQSSDRPTMYDVIGQLSNIKGTNF